MKNYRAKKNSGFSDKDAKSIGSFLKKKFPDGSPKPAKLVELAKEETSPLHKYFDWDNKKAAHKWRLHQARQIICMVYVTIKEDEDPEKEVLVREYESVIVDGKRKYQDSETVLADVDLVDQVIQSALRQLELWEKKFSIYKSLRKLVEDVGEIRKKHNPTNKKKRKK